MPFELIGHSENIGGGGLEKCITVLSLKRSFSNEVKFSGAVPFELICHSENIGGGA